MPRGLSLLLFDLHAAFLQRSGVFMRRKGFAEKQGFSTLLIYYVNKGCLCHLSLGKAHLHSVFSPVQTTFVHPFDSRQSHFS